MSDNETGETLPGGRKRAPRVGRLHTVGHLVSEMGKIYRLARRGDISTADAMRYVQMLALMRQAKEASDLEDRINALERDERPAETPKLTPVWTPDREKVPA